MASGGGSSLVPVLPPFLTKCCDMVDDPSTDDTVSWSKTSNSFVIWDPHAFSQDLLPKYFKHSNLSSFVRQLNTYGFHKVDPDRWEFANEGFLRGQKHLLKTITRRKPAHNNIVPPQQQPHPKTESVNGIIEVGNFGFEEEIEILKRDKNALMQELIKARQHQQNSELELHSLVRRIRCMEQKQLEMMSLLAMVVQTPNFIAQLVQQNVNDRWSNINKRRRRLPPPEHNVLEGAEAVSDGQMIKYQPFAPEIMKSSFSPVVNSKESGSAFNDLHSNGVSMTVGDDLALPLQENGSLTNLEDLEQLLASSAGENSEQIEPGALAEYMRSLDFTEQETDGCMGNLTSEKGCNNMVVW